MLVESILQSGVRRAVTPGLAACVKTKQPSQAVETYFIGRKAFGLSTVDDQTVYDLASLTKVLCTTLVTAYAVDLGRLDIEESLWPNWPQVKVRHILQHTSGLPAYIPFYQTYQGKKAITQAALATQLIYSTGIQTLYSDIGFIALGDLLEKRLGDSLDIIFAEVSKRYFGHTDLCFVNQDKANHHSKIHHVAPTEKRRGLVDDDNCFAMGGVAGHAGLFGRLSDVAKACEWFLESILGSSLGVAGVIRSFAKEPGERALGFDRQSKNSSTANVLSSDTVGHLGVIGTSFWCDPVENRFYVLLTNRGYIKNDPKKILNLRREFHIFACLFGR